MSRPKGFPNTYKGVPYTKARRYIGATHTIMDLLVGNGCLKISHKTEKVTFFFPESVEDAKKWVEEEFQKPAMVLINTLAYKG